MEQKLEWEDSTQYCTVCGRGFLPRSVSHKYVKTTPTCSLNCQEEFDHLMIRISNQQRKFISLDDELDWSNT